MKFLRNQLGESIVDIISEIGSSSAYISANVFSCISNFDLRQLHLAAKFNNHWSHSSVLCRHKSVQGTPSPSILYEMKKFSLLLKFFREDYLTSQLLINDLHSFFVFAQFWTFCCKQISSQITTSYYVLNGRAIVVLARLPSTEIFIVLIVVIFYRYYSQTTQLIVWNFFRHNAPC